MDDFFYRFRSVDRLLGKDGQPGELEKTEIFFASPEELNDPMEGRLSIYWSGDSIVWKNLFKHYLYALTSTYLDVMRAGSDAPHDENIIIPSDFEAGEVNGQILVDLVFTIYNSNEILLETVESLAHNRAKVDELQLSALILPLHQELLYCVYNAFKQLNYPNIGLDFLEKLSSQRKEVFKVAIIPVNKRHSFEDEGVRGRAFRKLHSNSEQQRLMLTYREETSRHGFNFLTHVFPYSFIKALKRMMYPDWYTACFMSKCDDSSIWGSYGANHTGLCLKYKAKCEGNTHRLPITLPVGTRSIDELIYETRNVPLREVSYDRKVQEVNFFNAIGNYSESSLRDNWFTSEEGKTSECMQWLDNFETKGINHHWKILEVATTTKLKVWKNENEYRLVIHPTIFTLPKEKRAIRYDFNSLEGIIFGIRTTLETKVRTMKIIKKLMEDHGRTEFRFYQASYDSDTDLIRHDELNLISL